MPTDRIFLHFAPLAPPLADQLAEQGVTLPTEDVEHFQHDADAVTRLYLRGLIPFSQAGKVRERLFNRILKTAPPSHPRSDER